MPEPEIWDEKWRRWFEAIARATAAPPKEQRARKPVRPHAPPQAAWTPEGEARLRLAKLLVEAEAACRGRPARWEQLALPGWEGVKRRPGPARP